MKEEIPDELHLRKVRAKDDASQNTDISEGIDQISSDGDAVLKFVDSVGSDIERLRTEINSLKTRVSALEAALSGASIDAECNGDGTITVTLTLGD